MDPNPPDIKQAATDLAHALPTIKEFIFTPNVPFTGFTTNRVDVGLWKANGRSLLLATNMNNFSTSVPLGEVFPRGAKVTQLLNSGGELETSPTLTSKVNMQALGSIAYVVG